MFNFERDGIGLGNITVAAGAFDLGVRDVARVGEEDEVAHAIDALRGNGGGFPRSGGMAGAALIELGEGGALRLFDAGMARGALELERGVKLVAEGLLGGEREG